MLAAFDALIPSLHAIKDAVHKWFIDFTEWLASESVQKQIAIHKDAFSNICLDEILKLVLKEDGKDDI